MNKNLAKELTPTDMKAFVDFFQTTTRAEEEVIVSAQSFAENGQTYGTLTAEELDSIPNQEMHKLMFQLTELPPMKEKDEVVVVKSPAQKIRT